MAEKRKAKFTFAGQGAALSAHEPTYRERVQYALSDLFGSMGADNYRAGDVSRRVTDLAEWTPFGMLTGMDDANRAGSAGDYLGMGVAALGAMPMAGKADDVVKGGIRAYHGSPHSFDKFSMDKIGTGEGAQAYGHGLYMAENPSVGRDYRDAIMSSKDMPQNMKIGGKDVQEFYSNIENKAARMPATAAQGEYDKMALLEDLMHEGDVLAVRERISEGAYSPEVAEWFEKQVAPNFSRDGTLYEVNIAADPDAFLDWDKPLSEQPHLQEVMPKLGFQPAPFPYSGWMGDKLVGKDDYAETLLRSLGEKGAGEQKLKEAGIPGIKYLDAGSRSAGDGSRNYVVFDENLVSIVKKYGIPAAIGAGLITEEMGRQMQAQGITGT